MSMYYPGSYQAVPYMQYPNCSTRHCGYDKVKSAMPHYPYPSYYPANSYGQWPVPGSALNTSNSNGINSAWMSPSNQYNRQQPLYWNQRLDGASLAAVETAARSYLSRYNYPSSYKVDTGTRSTAYPTYFNPQSTNFRVSGNSGYGTLINATLGGGNRPHASKDRKAMFLPKVSPVKSRLEIV